MKLTKRQLQVIQQALGYAVMYAKTESETAEFALMKLDVEKQIRVLEKVERHDLEHDKIGCPFNYCANNPPCIGKCRHKR